ncbi:hypothetical protein ACP4OV_004370 [Aristida adscensionis]
MATDAPPQAQEQRETAPRRSRTAEAGSAAGNRKARSEKAEEAPRSRRGRALDGTLVGARIRVWWPYDKKFYDGVVKAFGNYSRMHKVVYDDGDIENLLLKNEKWELIAEGQDAASDTPRDIRAKRRSLQKMNEGKTETPESGSDARDAPKKRGRPRGPSSRNIPVTLEGENAEKDAQDTSKTGSDLDAKTDEAGPVDASSDQAGDLMTDKAGPVDDAVAGSNQAGNQESA